MFKWKRLKQEYRWQPLIVLTLSASVALTGLGTSQPQEIPALLAHGATEIEVAASPDSALQTWAFEETFDGDPASPSQELLPRNFDYVVTHRSHPQEQFTKEYELFPADHGDDCAGPNFEVSPLPQHLVRTVQTSNGTNIDQSFYICKNHMMSSMGEVDPYSLSAFWPKQAFDFSDGGTLEFEVNVNRSHLQPELSKAWERSWWEIMIAPRDLLKVAAGPPFPEAAIDETYPTEHIVLDFRRLVRRVRVGTGQLAPDGWVVDERERGQYDWEYWYDKYPDDPANLDRRIRRKMRIQLERNQITWSIQTAEGTWDDFVVDVPGGLPFEQGLVLFKTHAYTPHKQDNYDTYTFHWDNIRFDGPVVGQYDAYEADDVVYLQRNGDRPIGDTQTVNINLPRVGANPVLFGQVHQPKMGQVLVSINGQPDIVVHPYDYNIPDCMSGDWKSFRLPLDSSLLQEGDNTITWTVGPRPDCEFEPYTWDGFSIKSLEIQMDRSSSSPQPTSTPVPPTATPTPSEPTPTQGPTQEPTQEPTALPTQEPNDAGITVQLFVDDNSNGLFDAGEEALAGVLLSVDGDTQSGSGVTDENGRYLFPTSGESFTITIPIPPGLANGASEIRLSALGTAADEIDITVVNPSEGDSPDGDGTTTLPDADLPDILLPLVMP